jgi:hypothetical protein
MGGTHGDSMYCHSTQGWISFKLEEVCDNRPTVDFKVNKGQMNNVLNSKHKIPPGLFGTPTETKVTLQDINTKALIDTGSTVSTLSHTFYKEHLSHLELKLLHSLLNIECADGKQLPYEGYIETDIYINDLDETHPCVFLVTPGSPYHMEVPILLGTNILTSIMNTYKEKHGERFLQTSKLTTPWYSSCRCILLRDKELNRNNKLAIVKYSGKKSVTIPPNSNITLSGYMDKQLPYHTTAAMVSTTEGSIVPSDLDISPSLIEYRYQQCKEIRVNISNITTRTVNISPHALICEL